MAVSEKRIVNIEETLVRQDEQIAKQFSQINEMREMFISIKGMWKGLIIGFGVMVASDIGIVEQMMKILT
tara:strand:- start:16 stop:225 length:210 start_codon:yes stop_codon:yes gene_type:complete